MLLFLEARVYCPLIPQVRTWWNWWSGPVVLGWGRMALYDHCMTIVWQVFDYYMSIVLVVRLSSPWLREGWHCATWQPHSLASHYPLFRMCMFTWFLCTYISWIRRRQNCEFYFIFQGLAPQRKAKKNIRRNCPIWVQLGSVDTQLI